MVYINTLNRIDGWIDEWMNGWNEECALNRCKRNE